MRLMYYAITLATLALVASACGAAPKRLAPVRNVDATTPTAVLRIEVSGVRAHAGHIVAAVYDDAGAFPHRELAFRSASVAATGNPVVVELAALPPGRYAAVVYHDADDDGDLDTNLVGYPTEPFGFSNDATLATFGPPDFDACAFEVKSPSSAIKLSLGNRD